MVMLYFPNNLKEKVHSKLGYIKKNYIYGLLSFVLYSLSFLIGYETESANHLFMPLKALLILLSAILFTSSCNNNCSNRVKLSYSILNLVILIYEIILLLAVGKTIFFIRDYPALVNSFVWITCSAFSVIRFRRLIIDWLYSLLVNKEISTLIISSALTAIIIILLSCEPNRGIMFTWDSDTLYEFIFGLDFNSLYDSNLLTFHSHVVTVYAHVLVLLKLLFNNIRIAYFVLNSFCIVIASFGMTFLLKTLVPSRRTIEYALANSVFLFSPWINGLSTYHMYDYYIWCLFPLLICYMVKRNWIGFFIIGVMISFSKTTGIVVFGSVCIGLLITDFIQLKIIPLKDIKYWFFVSIAVVFFLYFRLGIDESTQFEDTKFGINYPHIIHQLKLYFTTNFLWIFMILTILLIISIYVSKRTVVQPNTYYTILVLIISDVIFLCFNLVCITYRLPRYMNSHISVLYICSLIFVLMLPARIARYTTCIILTSISCVSSYVTIDPVSLSLFNTFNVGDRSIIDFDMRDIPSLGDSIVYNREYYSYEVLLDMTLTHVINDMDSGDMILFSMGSQSNTWGLSGGRYSYEFTDGKKSFDLFYDKRLNGLANGYSYEYNDDPEMIPFNTQFIFPQETIKSSICNEKFSRIYYIFMPTLNDNKESEIYESYNVEAHNSFSFRGWQMDCITFSRY